MNNVENNKDSGNKSVSLQIPYMYSNDGPTGVALGLSKWKQFHFISIVTNEGNGFNWQSPVQLGLTREQAITLLDNSISLFNALYPESKLDLPNFVYRIGGIEDVTKMTHMYTPIGYYNAQSAWVETGGVVVGYKVAENNNFVFGLSIRSTRNDQVSEAFFPFPYRPIDTEIQDGQGNVLNKISHVQLEFLGFLEMLHGIVYGPSRFMEVAIKKTIGMMMGGRSNNRNYSNSGSGGGANNFQNNDQSGEDAIPFF